MTPFEIITVIKGIPRKNGKKPTIDGFSSISSWNDENGPVLYVNREKHDVRPLGGKRLKGTNSADPLRKFEHRIGSDGTVEIKFEQETRFDRKAVRGLFKIALENIAFFEGLEVARNKEFDGVRRFVMNDSGNYRAIMIPDQNSTYESYFAPCQSKEGYARVCGMTLLGIGVLCDFDPEFRGGTMLLAEMAKQPVAGQVIPNWPRHLWLQNNP